MKITIAIVFVLLSFSIHAQTSALVKGSKETKQPRLIIGIVIDQMRYDYLSKYYNKFSENGFKKLMNQGFRC